jgi:hypothetical protein
MNLFENLSAIEDEALLKFPVYMTFLAAFKDDEPDENEIKTAIKYINAQTFSCDPILVEFYNEAEKVFKNNMEQIDNDLPKGNAGREAAIKKELLNLEKITFKLGNEYTSALNRSMNSFKEHVSKAHYNPLSDFVLPLTALGLTDNNKHGDRSRA